VISRLPGFRFTPGFACEAAVTKPEGEIRMSSTGDFLPMNLEEAARKGWQEIDVVIVTGDAYVDHPSFGAAIIGRWLETGGFRVGIIAQPRWNSADDFKRLGKPRLFFGVTAGNLDSMVAHYTPNKRLRRDDAYSPENRHGMRPNRATIVYANRLRECFRDVPIIIGGIEASLRRLAHYDFWEDKVRRSILIDSKADALVYGMGERPVLEIAQRLQAGENISDIRDVRGTVVVSGDVPLERDCVILPSFEEASSDPMKYVQAFDVFCNEHNALNAWPLVQASGDRWVMQNPPALPLSTAELDVVYDAPFTRTWHPSYDSAGGIHALETVQTSITSHRGCYGACSFCALYFHQGPIIQSRSTGSIVREARKIISQPGFHGMFSDIGGPTANMYATRCRKGWSHCKRPNCLMPKPCKNLDTNHAPYLAMLDAVRNLPGVKKVAVSTGIRYDLALADSSHRFIEELCEHYVSGQIKLAPEHVSTEVLEQMNKPPISVYKEFIERYNDINKRLGKRQYYVQYFISSHPGCELRHMIELAEYVRDGRFYPEQVQDFTPTPMTVATCMYHTGINPLSRRKVAVARGDGERRMQRALIQFANPDNYALVKDALMRAGRGDLAGGGRGSLIGRARPGNRGRQSRKPDDFS
jgi:uncharacterized radical SAM protein YgiQ